MAFSGLCPFPFRTKQIEDILNNNSLTIDDKISQTLTVLLHNLINDMQGSAEYRQFVLTNILTEILTSLEGVA